jgi:hypothetical protein
MKRTTILVVALLAATALLFGCIEEPETDAGIYNVNDTEPEPEPEQWTLMHRGILTDVRASYGQINRLALYTFVFTDKVVVVEGVLETRILSKHVMVSVYAKEGKIKVE